MRVEEVRRLDLGTFVRPAEETGTGEPRIEAVYGYAVPTATSRPHHNELIILDTGLGEGEEETEAWYRPRRAPLATALQAHGYILGEVISVVNCHLHFDHIGDSQRRTGPTVQELWAGGCGNRHGNQS